MSNKIRQENYMKGGEKMTDSAALREKIKERGLKYGYIAKKLGLSYYGLSLKIENKNEFRTSEVALLCEMLNITSLKEKERIFFAQKVERNSTRGEQ